MQDGFTGGGEIGDGGDGQELNPSASATRPPLAPGHEWRSRALAAEDALQKANDQLRRVQEEFEAAKASAAADERLRQIRGAVNTAGPIDADVVLMLVKAQLAQTPEADVNRVVAELRRTKPYLFAAADGARQGMASAVGAAIGTGGGSEARESVQRKAEEARASGDRRALLGYLRARRGV